MKVDDDVELETVDPARAVFGQRVKGFREQAGLSQRALSERMRAAGFRWHQTTANKTEAADRPVPVEEAVALAQIFGVTVDELVRAPGDERPLQDRLRALQLERVALLKETDELKRRAAGVTDELRRVAEQIEAIKKLIAAANSGSKDFPAARDEFFAAFGRGEAAELWDAEFPGGAVWSLGRDVQPAEGFRG